MHSNEATTTPRGLDGGDDGCGGGLGDRLGIFNDKLGHFLIAATLDDELLLLLLSSPRLLCLRVLLWDFLGAKDGDHEEAGDDVDDPIASHLDVDDGEHSNNDESLLFDGSILLLIAPLLVHDDDGGILALSTTSFILVVDESLFN